MTCKMFEIRDEGTFIPVLAVRLETTCEVERWLMARAGYGRTPEEQGTYILLCKINGGAEMCATDPFNWGRNPRTYFLAHQHILAHFDELETGAVVDIEYIQGWKSEPKVSERVASPLH